MKKLNQKGYSIIELLVVLGILGVIISSIGTFFIMNLKSSQKADEQLEVQYQLQNAMAILTDRLQNAQSIAYSENANLKTLTLSFNNSWYGGTDDTDIISLNKATEELMVDSIKVGENISDIVFIPLNSNGETPVDISMINSVNIILVTVTAEKGNTSSSISTTINIRNKQ